MVKEKKFELPHCAGVAFDILPDVVVRTIIHYQLLCICALVHLCFGALSSTARSYARPRRCDHIIHYEVK